MDMDSWDWLCIASCLIIVAGVGWIYPPAGLIALGVFGLGIYWLREASSVVNREKPRT